MNKAPKLRFNGFYENWKTCLLGKSIVLYDKERKPVKEQERISGEYAYYGATGIIDYIDDYIFEGEYLLLGEDGANIVTRSAPLIYKTSGKFWVNNHAHIFKPKKDFNIDFMKHRLELINYVPYNTGTAQPKLNADSIKSIPFKAPEKEEQDKIASFFSLIDKKIELQTEKVEELKKYKKGIMQKIFSQELRFKDDNGNEFIEWEEKKLGKVCEIKKGQQLNKEFLLPQGKYYALNGGVEPSGFTDKYNTERGVISISEGGNSCGYVKYNNERFWSGGHCYTLENSLDFINTKYLFQFLKYNELKIMALRVGSGLPNIQKSDLSNFIIKIPEYSEQLQIGNLLYLIDTKIINEEKRLDLLNQYKKGLLQQMFV